MHDYEKLKRWSERNIFLHIFFLSFSGYDIDCKIIKIFSDVQSALKWINDS